MNDPKTPLSSVITKLGKVWEKITYVNHDIKKESRTESDTRCVKLYKIESKLNYIKKERELLRKNWVPNKSLSNRTTVHTSL